MKLSFVFLIACFVLFVAAGCTPQEKSVVSEGLPPAPLEEMVVKEIEQDIQEIQITAENWEFNPSQIHVTQGEMVRLKIISRQGIHGFSLPAFGVEERLLENKEVLIEFIPDKTGTFDFFCNVPCGSGHSLMQGTLIVT